MWVGFLVIKSTDWDIKMILFLVIWVAATTFGHRKISRLSAFVAIGLHAIENSNSQGNALWFHVVSIQRFAGFSALSTMND